VLVNERMFHETSDAVDEDDRMACNLEMGRDTETGQNRCVLEVLR
jgi:hypothetical protein